MKKFLLSLFAFAATTVAAFAQTNLVKNGGFEEWNGNTPKYWQSASTASSATLAPSDDAHSGNYAVKVSGSTSSNKRLAYTEVTLKAGTYNVKFYAKAATDENANVRPGYVPVDANNKADSKGYIYSDDTFDLTTASWTEVTYSFTLDNETRLALLVMNPKKPGKDILVDDYELTTTDGGLVGESGGTTEPTDPTQPSGKATLFSEAFDNGLGEFTTDDKHLDEGLTYVWKGDQQYKYVKASAYVKGTNYASESWLVSPVIDLNGATDCTLSFSHVANFYETSDAFQAACKVMVRPADGEWTELAYEGVPAGNAWKPFVDATASLKAYDGQKIQIAFRYTSDTSVAGTWEVKDLKVEGTKQGGTTEPTTGALPYKQAFDNGEGDFTIEDKELGELSYVWKANTEYGYMKASAYVNGANQAAESWLVSPEIDMTGYEDCTLSFEHAAKFFGSSEELTNYCQVVVRVPGESDWEEVSYEGLPSGSDWNFVTANGSLKAYDGKKIQLAFRYTSTEEVAGSWEIKNLVVNGTKSTGINQAVDGTAQKFVIYSLDGRRLSAPEKGINIINGKKVLVK